MSAKDDCFILGAGVTGLGAAMATGLEVYEAAASPGGLCSSYYMQPGVAERLSAPPPGDQAYRFELGGGHWIFGGDRNIVEFMTQLVSMRRYARRSSVYLHDRELFVPYPIQNHLDQLDSRTSQKVAQEILHPKKDAEDMHGWLHQNFGKTLCEIFFFPFHDLYTAGLYRHVAPQNDYESPASIPMVLGGLHEPNPGTGHNGSFFYPERGLDDLTRAMAERCTIHYGKRVVKIDPLRKQVCFEDGQTRTYGRIISTLPLNKMIDLTEIEISPDNDPYTSVLVLNIGAERGESCPDDHWIYCSDTRAGFHRVGFHSNVDPNFLPAKARKTGDRVSLYVEKAFVGPTALSVQEFETYSKLVVKELRSWGFIKALEVMDPTWIDVAYTWTLPKSKWRDEALSTLDAHGIHQVGRYGCWKFQGIADSIRDGLLCAAMMQLWKNGKGART